MDEITVIARDHGLKVIEDAAHAVEATVGGRKIGSISDFTCFSLYATKSLAGGEGGLITTASEPAARRLRLLRSQGISRDPWRRRESQTLGYYDVEEPGFKANLGDLHAAAALPGLGGIGARRTRRLEIVARYDEALDGLEGITPIGRPDYGQHAHHLYVVRVDAGRAGANRDRYAEALMAEHISTGLHFLPVHTLTWYRQHLPEVDLPVAQRAGSEVMSLPLAAGHTDADVDDVIAALHKVHAALKQAVSRRTRVVLEGVISVAFLIVILKYAGVDQVWDTLKHTDLEWFIPAVAVNMATVGVMALPLEAAAGGKTRGGVARLAHAHLLRRPLRGPVPAGGDRRRRGAGGRARAKDR